MRPYGLSFAESESTGGSRSAFICRATSLAISEITPLRERSVSVGTETLSAGMYRMDLTAFRVDFLRICRLSHYECLRRNHILCNVIFITRT